MVAPIILIFINITFYIFPFILNKLRKVYGYVFKFRPLIHSITLIFFMGVVLSSLNSTNISNSLLVLPNYIYWGILILLISSHAKNIQFNVIAFSSVWGIIIITFYYYLQTLLPNLFFLANVSPNGLAFNLICFAPLAISKINNSKGKYYALSFLLLLSLVLLFEGRRAGFILVLLGGFFSIYLNKIVFTKLLFVGFIFTAISFLLNLGFVNSLIKNSNDRIYDLIYETEKVKVTDQSYLIRVAMTKKGFKIFEEFPLLGVGLNNFSKVNISIPGDFEGSDIVLRVKNINEISAHNSYISILAEGGLLTFVPFVLLLVLSIFYGLFNFNKMDTYAKSIVIATIMMSIHLYFISAIINVFAWYLLGLCSSLIYKYK